MSTDDSQGDRFIESANEGKGFAKKIRESR